jgi:pilus assembly protein Flp/PilA
MWKFGFNPSIKGEGKVQTCFQKSLAFIRDEEGASAIEYALLVALVALGITAALTAFSGKMSSLFTAAGDKLDEYQPS